MSQEIFLLGSVASLFAGLATVLGALPLFVIGKPSEQQQTLMLGFAAGVMLAASFFSLVIPGIDQARAMGAGRLQASATMVCAILLGAFCLSLLNRLVPPLDGLGLGPAGIASARFRRVWLFVAAITLHNFPEGMAVGVSFGGGDPAAGLRTAIGIGLQNIPEGLAVAASLLSLGYSTRSSVLAALASGCVEPIAGVIGLGLVAAAQVLLPWGLGFAAGAMIYVVASEIIPDAHVRVPGGERATAGLMIGLVGMMFLDTVFS